jgi:hypothetical protein
VPLLQLLLNGGCSTTAIMMCVVSLSSTIMHMHTKELLLIVHAMLDAVLRSLVVVVGMCTSI